MASILQKLLRKSNSTRAINFFTHQSQAQDLRSPLFIQQHRLPDTKLHHPHKINLAPFSRSSEEEESKNSQFSQIYPMFPFGFSVNPISSAGLVQSDVENVVSFDRRVNFAEPKTEELNHSQCSPIYPSFLFGCGLNQILSSGFHWSELCNGVSDDSGMIWADSVKKKRKRKMNKHKYKKLKKSLRRKT